MRHPVIVILLFALVLAAGPGARHAAADDAAGRKKELQRIKREMREKKKKIRRADSQERSILAELDRIDRGIQAGKAELAEHRGRLGEAEAALRTVEGDNDRISRELAGLKLAYAARLRTLYKRSRSGDAAAVLVTTGPDDGFRLTKYLGVIAERDRALLREYAGALDALAIKQAAIAAQERDILERKRTIEAKAAELETRKQRKAALLTGVREKKGVYEQTLRELEESSVSLWAMIRKSEQERKTAAAARPAPPKAVPQEGTGTLPWPAEGRVLTRFGMQRHPVFKTMVFRRGIEIEVREGEPVRAVADGQVVYADWYKGYGKLVIIEHGLAFYTLYGNLSRVDVEKDGRVEKGQVIGLAGDTGSLKGAKLYFEVRRDGEARDPLAWLAKR